jgi:SAM-dependent MidA family methyltransferase
MSGADATAGRPLLAALRARIARDGPMPVEAFMHACLADPEHGAWQRAGIIGAGGDFITAPEISQVFGELIGLWCAVAWQGMGRPASLRLVELGPGRGSLMRDALRAARVVPGFLGAASVHLVEISRALRDEQRRVLGADWAIAETRRAAALPPAPPRKGEGRLAAVDWHEGIEGVPPGPAIVVANEFLDALPVRQLVFAGGAWHERVVEADTEGDLRFGVGARATDGLPAGAPPAEGDILELRPGEAELLSALARRQAPLYALFIDYGPAEAAYGDTLQAVRHHRWVDPLAHPGIADLTTHVQFARLAQSARAAGLAAEGPLPQGELLGRLGIAERAARLMAANPSLAGEIEAGVQRLISPTGMGSLFKAMAVRTPGLPPAPGFG